MKILQSNFGMAIAAFGAIVAGFCLVQYSDWRMWTGFAVGFLICMYGILRKANR